MDSDGLPMIGSGVDYSEVTAIHQKRTLAFINYFITNTASFLNNFARSVEARITEYEVKIQRLEAEMDILEAKLGSVPGLDEDTALLVAKTESVCLQSTLAIENAPATAINEEPIPTVPPEMSKVPSGMIPARDEPVYKRFFRMLQVGVPEPAVRMKMQAEGLDPEILSNPDQLVPSTDLSTTKGDNNGEDSSASGTD